MTNSCTRTYVDKITVGDFCIEQGGRIAKVQGIRMYSICCTNSTTEEHRHTHMHTHNHRIICLSGNQTYRMQLRKEMTYTMHIYYAYILLYIRTMF